MKRLKKDPLEGHPRAAETRQAMVEAHFEDEQEVVELQSSELACAVADAWAAFRERFALSAKPSAPSYKLFEALNRLELVTRASGMRSKGASR